MVIFLDLKQIERACSGSYHHETGIVLISVSIIFFTAVDIESNRKYEYMLCFSFKESQKLCCSGAVKKPE